jgi:hypothetical protein
MLRFVWAADDSLAEYNFTHGLSTFFTIHKVQKHCLSLPCKDPFIHKRSNIFVAKMLTVGGFSVSGSYGFLLNISENSREYFHSQHKPLR